MFVRIAAFILLAVAVAVAFPAAAREKEKDASPAAAPPLFKVVGDNGVVYLFGTTGAPAPDRSWRTRSLARAIDQSETMWFEAPVDDPLAMETANRIFTERGRAKEGVPLSSLLDEETRNALDAAATSPGLSRATLDPLRPWAAFVLLSGRLHEGVEGEAVDAALLSEARGRGRSVRYLFSIEDSLGLLTDMPAETEKNLLAGFVRDFTRQRDGAAAAFDAWKSGDLAGVDAAMNEELRTGAPDAFTRLVTGRIGALAERIGAILNEPGTAFVAVNAGYLAGESALPEALAARGYAVERILE